MVSVTCNLLHRLNTYRWLTFLVNVLWNYLNTSMLQTKGHKLMLRKAALTVATLSIYSALFSAKHLLMAGQNIQ